LIEECHVDTNIKSKYGESILSCAAFSGDVEMAKYLIEECHIDINNDILLSAVHGYSTEMVKYLIEEYHVDVKNFFYPGIPTPLALAAKLGQLKIAQYLLEHSAKIDIQNINNSISSSLFQDDCNDFISFCNFDMRKKAVSIVLAYKLALDSNNDFSDLTASIDPIYFVGKYKEIILKFGIKHNTVAEITANENIPEYIKAPLCLLFEQEQNNFNAQCTDIIYHIEQGNVSPLGLIDLIEQKQKGNFDITYNKHTTNLIEFYQKHDDNNLLTDLNSFLFTGVSDPEGTKALFLKQAVYTTNIKIIEDESLRILSAAPDLLRTLLQIVTLPPSLKDTIEKNIANYNNSLENHLFQGMLEHELDGVEPAIDLTGEESVNEFSFD